MRRSEEIRKLIKSYEAGRDKFVIAMRKELAFVNKQIVRLNRELSEIQDGGREDEEI